MASELGRKFYDLLRIHYEQGTKIEVLDLSEQHKAYMRIIDDLFEHWRHNPAMDTIGYIREQYDVREYATIYKLTRALNYVCAMAQVGIRDMMRFKANHYADRMARIGDVTGDWKPMDKAVSHITKINGLDQPDPAESIDEQVPKMGYMLTTRASDVKQEAQDHTPAQIEALFKQYGAKRDNWQQLLDQRRTSADDYDAEGNYIRRGRPAQGKQEQAEDAEIMQLDREFEEEMQKEEEKQNGKYR